MDLTLDGIRTVDAREFDDFFAAVPWPGQWLWQWPWEWPWPWP